MLFNAADLSKNHASCSTALLNSIDLSSFKFLGNFPFLTIIEKSISNTPSNPPTIFRSHNDTLVL
jgi:hypothetical protein